MRWRNDIPFYSQMSRLIFLLRHIINLMRMLQTQEIKIIL